jgi:hypothetical protein
MSEPKQKFRHNDGRGSLFINDYKENDRHPDLTGKAMIGGQEYNIALWKDQTQDGKFKGNLKFDLADAFKEHMEGGAKVDPRIHNHPLGAGFKQKDDKKVEPLFTEEDLKPKKEEEDIPF